MSATGRGKKREPNDFYRTPSWCVRRLLESREQWDFKIWAEPCAGDGAIIKAAEDYLGPGREWWAVEPAQELANIIAEMGQVAWFEQAKAEDSLLIENVKEACGKRFDSVCISNPPYSRAQEIIDYLLDAQVFSEIFMLLPLNFLSSIKRKQWHVKFSPSVYVLPNRPSFNGVGRDACDYAWFKWYRYQAGEIRYLNVTHRAEISSCRV